MAKNATTTEGGRLSSGDLQRILGQEFDGRGRPLGRAYLDRLIRDHVELTPLEVVAGTRQWPPDCLDSFRTAIRREREGGQL